MRLFAVVMVICAVLAAVMSVAALVDPFAWMPSANELWSDCQESDVARFGSCDWSDRFPDIWWHAGLNLLYAIAALIALAGLAGGVKRLREVRPQRFGSASAWALYAETKETVVGATIFAAVLAALPIIVSIL